MSVKSYMHGKMMLFSLTNCTDHFWRTDLPRKTDHSIMKLCISLYSCGMACTAAWRGDRIAQQRPCPEGLLLANICWWCSFDFTISMSVYFGESCVSMSTWHVWHEPVFEKRHSLSNANNLKGDSGSYHHSIHWAGQLGLCNTCVSFVFQMLLIALIILCFKGSIPA